MLIVMDKKATESEINAVVTAVEARGYTARPIPGGERVSIGVLYNKGAVDTSLFIGYPGVRTCHRDDIFYPGISNEQRSINCPFVVKYTY